jgi:hypothetical protein
MADELPKASRPASAPRATASSAPDVPDVVTYSREELVENSRAYLNVSPAAVVGALAGERKKNFELDEAVQLVKDYLGRPVDVDQGQPDPEEED